MAAAGHLRRHGRPAERQLPGLAEDRADAAERATIATAVRTAAAEHPRLTYAVAVCAAAGLVRLAEMAGWL